MFPPNVNVIQDFIVPCPLVKLREADERTRSALAATEARRQGQGQQLLDKLAAAKSEEMARTDAVEHALGEHRHATREAVETGYRANRTRSDELHAEMQSLEERLTAMVEDAQRNESARAEAILHKTQEQASKGVSSPYVPKSRYIMLNIGVATVAV